MAEEVPEYVVEILAELRELRREVAKLQRDVAELYKRLSELQPSAPANADAAARALREAAEKLEAVAQAVAEHASLIKSLAAEEWAKRDETCLALLEKLMALQEAPTKR